MFNGKRFNLFPIRSETRKGSPLLPHLFNRVEKVLIRAIRGNNNNLNKEIKETQARKEEAKLSLLIDSMVLYVETLKHFKNKLLKLINKQLSCKKQNQLIKVGCVSMY